MIHTLLETPVLLLLVIFLPAFLLIGRLRASGPLLQKILVVCGALCLAVFALINILNVHRPGAFWQDEPNILAIAAIYRHGGPMYHSTAAPVLYSLLYGPTTYLVFVPFLTRFAHPFPLIHACMALLNLATLGLLYGILREQLSRVAALGLLSVAAAFLLTDAMHLLGVRGDPWLLFSICLALFAVLKARWPLAVLGAGIGAGLALDFKITVVPVIWLLLAILYRRHGLRPLLAACTLTVATALSLFLLPGISLANYLSWLLLSSHQGLLAGLLVRNLLAAAFLLAAALALCVLGDRRLPRNVLGLNLTALGLFALCSSILTGSKDGAGPWHLWPMLPFLLFWAAVEAAARGVDAAPQPARRLSDFSPLGLPLSARSLQVLAALSIAASVVTLRVGFRDLRLMHSSSVNRDRLAQKQAEAEMDALVRRFAGVSTDASGSAPGRASAATNLAMGYGTWASGDRLTDLRFELADDGEQYFFDENAEIEGIKARLALPAGLLQRILGCQDVWLIPHGQAPFSTLRYGVLPDGQTPFLFPDSIRLHFADAHILLESGPSYDLWGCPAKD
jgi:hypothetical protein